MRILVTNDDGIYSPGIFALAKAASHFGKVIVVAPNVEQSSMGHAVTHSRPINYKKSPIAFPDTEAYSVNGTPADCVALGIHLYKHIDMVLSGINMGPNLGNSIWHSGTLAAAKQAVLFGIKGIALSTPTENAEPNFDKLSSYVDQVLKQLMAETSVSLYNVNFPSDPQGILWTKQSVRHYDGKIVPGTDPMGRKHYWFTVIPLETAEKDTDRWAMENNYISVTPLRLDLTDEAKFGTLKKEHPW